MNTVDDYVNSFEGIQKEWLVTFITFMRESFPDINEVFSFKMPMYKFDGKYIAFSAAKDHFSFHTLDFEMIEELKGVLTRSKFGKGCAKVRYDDKSVIPLLFDACRKIVERNKIQ